MERQRKAKGKLEESQRKAKGKPKINRQNKNRRANQNIRKIGPKVAHSIKTVIFPHIKCDLNFNNSRKNASGTGAGMERGPEHFTRVIDTLSKNPIRQALARELRLLSFFVPY